MKNHTNPIILPSKFACGIILRWLNFHYTPCPAIAMAYVIFNELFIAGKAMKIIMKIKDGFITKKIGDKIVAITVGKHTKDFNGMITLNETGCFIWNCLEKDTDKESIVNAIIKEYDISTADAMAEVEKFITVLEENDLLEK